MRSPREPAAARESSGGAPVRGRERIQLLDALRGFALLGIFLGNVQHLSGALLPMAPGRGQALDEAALWLLHFAVEGKFYSLFALLFGIGFGIQLSRTDGREATARFRRRMLVLIAIGLLHFALWAGDILVLYAVVGLVLLAFRHREDRTLLRWAAVLFALPVVLHAFAVGLAAIHPPEVPEILSRSPRRVLAIYAHGSFLDVLRDNLTYEAADRVFSLVASGRILKVLATFLLGLWIWRQRIPQAPDRHRVLLRRVLVAGSILGVIGNAGLATVMETESYVSLEPTGLLHPIFYAFGVPALALAIAAAFALLWERPTARAWLSPLVPAGRMALTNYVAQTVMAVLLFYGYGLGLFGQLRLVECLALAAVGFLLQVVWSAWWLRRFRYGPLEWVWRCLTYGRPLPIRRQ